MKIVLIKSFGLFWSIDAVSWGQVGGDRGRLEGLAKFPGSGGSIRSVLCDFWEERALYALYEQRDLVYVGRAVKTQLGRELSARRRGRFAGLWDNFSWFGVGKRVADQDYPNISKEEGYKYMKINSPGSRIIKPGEIVSALEALAIIITNPVLNRRFETLRGATEFDQFNKLDPKTNRQMLLEISESLEKLRRANKKMKRKIKNMNEAE